MQEFRLFWGVVGVGIFLGSMNFGEGILTIAGVVFGAILLEQIRRLGTFPQSVVLFGALIFWACSIISSNTGLVSVSQYTDLWSILSLVLLLGALWLGEEDPYW